MTMQRPGFTDKLLIAHRGGTTTDLEGRTTVAYDEPIQVEGAAAMIDFREQTLAAQAGMIFDAVVLVPHGTPVGQLDQVTVPAVKGPPLAGVYTVQSIRWNPLHIRLLVQRLGE